MKTRIENIVESLVHCVVREAFEIRWIIMLIRGRVAVLPILGLKRKFLVVCACGGFAESDSILPFLILAVVVIPSYLKVFLCMSVVEQAFIGRGWLRTAADVGIQIFVVANLSELSVARLISY